MKKISAHKTLCGFSLAEALITLLIVCLITLASIPILTKKKRTLSDGAHGQYYCTLNSEGDYVEYYSETSSGDIKDPDTWDLVRGTGYTDTVTLLNSSGQPYTKERDRCRFVAPLNARNFNVTVIGGGAGGHNGENEYVEIARLDSAGELTYFAASENEDYNLILVSGGGGGAGSPNDEHNGSAGQGGAGGAGGYIRIENLKLPKNNLYTYTVGAGGAGNTGNYHNKLRDKFLNPQRAGSGGESTFIGNNVDLRVPGATGGESISCTKKKCRGGAKGIGTTRDSIRATYTPDLKTSYHASSGADGNYGDTYCSKSGGERACGKVVSISAGKNSIPSFELDSNNNPIPISYGNGGIGRGLGNGAVAGNYGTSGVMILSQYDKKHGNGGAAGEISNRFIPSIEGYIVASIPVAAYADEKGGDVTVELYKNKTNNGIFLRAQGGEAPTTNITEPTAGEVSPWTYKGAGAKGGRCGSVKYESAGYEDVPKSLDVCTQVKCVLSYIEPSYIKANNTKTVTTGSGETATTTTNVVIPSGVDYLGSVDETCTYLSTTYSAIVKPISTSAVDNYVANLNITYLSKITQLDPGLKTSFFNFSNGDFGKYSNNNEAIGSAPNLSNYGCYYHEDILEYERTCTSSKVETLKDKVYKEGRRSQDCPSAGNGTEFGAGGGGGYAGDMPGIGGKGGKGAPGAVIIEW